MHIKRITTVCSFAALFLANSVAQGQENHPTFEVASVKPATLAPGAAPGGKCTGGPGTSDPENFRCSCVPLAAVLVRAYDISFTNLRGPDWVSWTATCYDFAAKVPTGSSKEQLQLMLQDLLHDRFHLVMHHETKVLPSYTLSIAKAGSKLKAHVNAQISELPNPGLPGALTWIDGHLHLTANDLDLKSLARLLTQVMQAPVVDETGLAGGYDFILDFAAPAFMTGGQAYEALPEISAALPAKLGLNLTIKNVPRDLIIVDQANKVPTEN